MLFSSKDLLGLAVLCGGLATASSFSMVNGTPTEGRPLYQSSTQYEAAERFLPPQVNSAFQYKAATAPALVSQAGAKRPEPPPLLEALRGPKKPRKAHKLSLFGHF